MAALGPPGRPVGPGAFPCGCGWARGSWTPSPLSPLLFPICGLRGRRRFRLVGLDGGLLGMYPESSNISWNEFLTKKNINKLQLHFHVCI